jgi:tetratricopeptide (TPR) repeat protein
MTQHAQTVDGSTPNAPVSDDVRARVDRLHADGFALRRDENYAAASDAFAQIAGLLPDDGLAQYNAGAASLEAGRLSAAAEFLDRAARLRRRVDVFRLQAHVAALQGDMPAARSAYTAATQVAPLDFAAHWGLFEVLQLLGDDAAALAHQRIALAQRSLHTVAARRQPPRTTILELCIAGTFQANIPLDFIIDAEHTTVHKLYLGEHPIPELPPYDVVFNTIADAPDAGPALSAAADFIARQDRPALNAPEHVHLTSREAIAAAFARSATVAVAPTMRTRRTAVRDVHPAFPFLIRPLGSHAGNDLAKIDDAGALDAYLAAAGETDEFYLAAFIDYRSADGYYRKYRIVFVDGVPYPVHLAISPRWMIHYYNAPMAENAWMRDEEHAFMREPDAVFDGLRSAGLREIAHAVPLDYFGIDCSIAPDGRVLLFEASTAMIVHLRDSVELYPYKAQYVPRVIRALERAIDGRIARAAAAR